MSNALSVKKDFSSLHVEFNSIQEMLGSCDKGVVFFGSSRIPDNHPIFYEAEQLSGELAKRGYSIITGGGPGIMAAGSKGAYASQAKTYGLCMDFEGEPPNPFIDNQNRQFCQHFFSRKYGLFHHAMAFVCFPGGFGTLDELFEILVLRQLKKITWCPIFLFASSYWRGLLEWIKEMPLSNKMIGEKDLEDLYLTDSVEEIIYLIKQSDVK